MREQSLKKRLKQQQRQHRREKKGIPHKGRRDPRMIPVPPGTRTAARPAPLMWGEKSKAAFGNIPHHLLPL